MKEVFPSNSTTENNLISINDSDRGVDPLSDADIFRIATQPTSRKELTDLFERGYRDAEVWCRREKDNQNQQQNWILEPQNLTFLAFLMYRKVKDSHLQ